MPNPALAAKWQSEIEKLRQSIEYFENGKMRLLQNDIDLSKDHVALLRSTIADLEEAIWILERDD